VCQCWCVPCDVCVSVGVGHVMCVSVLVCVSCDVCVSVGVCVM